MALCVIRALVAVDDARAVRCGELLARVAKDPGPAVGSAEFLALAAEDTDLRVTRDDLLALAFTIGRNREIAGLHYPTDSEAGRALADIVLVQLETKTEGTVNAVIGEVARE